MEKVFVEKFATFANYGSGWTAFIWDAPPMSSGPFWRLKIPVPEEVLGQGVIELTEVEAVSETEGVR